MLKFLHKLVRDVEATMKMHTILIRNMLQIRMGKVWIKQCHKEKREKAGVFWSSRKQLALHLSISKPTSS